MIDLCKLIWCAFARLFRSRAELEAEILVLRHQLNVLRRKSPGRLAFSSIDRVVFAGMYALAPNILDALKIVKPETALRWHRARIPARLALEIATTGRPAHPSRASGWSSLTTLGASRVSCAFLVCMLSPPGAAGLPAWWRSRCDRHKDRADTP